MNSVERLNYYGDLSPEESPRLRPSLPRGWPPTGEVRFNEVQLRYREGLPLVLRDLTFEVRPGEKVSFF